MSGTDKVHDAGSNSNAEPNQEEECCISGILLNLLKNAHFKMYEESLKCAEKEEAKDEGDSTAAVGDTSSDTSPGPSSDASPELSEQRKKASHMKTFVEFEKKLIEMMHGLRMDLKTLQECGKVPEKIIAAGINDGQLTFLLKWKGLEEYALIRSEDARLVCPLILIDFYEERLVWQDLKKQSIIV